VGIKARKKQIKEKVGWCPARDLGQATYITICPGLHALKYHSAFSRRAVAPQAVR